MKLIYTHENSFLVNHAKNILDNIGIKTVLKNEYLSGGIGELPPLEAWLELWLLIESDYEQAIKELESLNNNQSNPDWQCANCQELNEGQFDLCWNCQSINKPNNVI